MDCPRVHRQRCTHSQCLWPVEFWGHAAWNLQQRRTSHEWQHLVWGYTHQLTVQHHAAILSHQFNLGIIFTPLCSFLTERALLSAKMSPPWTAIAGAGQVHQQVFGLWTCWEAFVSLHTQRPVEHKWVFNFSVCFFFDKIPCWVFFSNNVASMCVSTDPDMSPIEAVADTGSSLFHKRYLKKIRKLGEVSWLSHYMGSIFFLVFFFIKPLCFASRVTLVRCICTCMTRKMTTRESMLLWRN